LVLSLDVVGGRDEVRALCLPLRFSHSRFLLPLAGDRFADFSRDERRVNRVVRRGVDSEEARAAGMFEVMRRCGVRAGGIFATMLAE
jgi:hypothetical protein